MVENSNAQHRISEVGRVSEVKRFFTDLERVFEDLKMVFISYNGQQRALEGKGL